MSSLNLSLPIVGSWDDTQVVDKLVWVWVGVGVGFGIGNGIGLLVGAEDVFAVVGPTLDEVEAVNVDYEAESDVELLELGMAEIEDVVVVDEITRAEVDE